MEKWVDRSALKPIDFATAQTWIKEGRPGHYPGTYNADGDLKTVSKRLGGLMGGEIFDANSGRDAVIRISLPYAINNDFDSYTILNREYEVIIRVPKNHVTWEQLQKIGIIQEGKPDLVWMYSSYYTVFTSGHKQALNRYRAILIFLNENFHTKFCI